MMNLRNWTLALVMACCAAPALAQQDDEDERVYDYRWRAHVMVGSQIADDSDYDTGTQFKVGIGRALSPYIMLDAQFNAGELSTNRGDDYERMATGLDFLYFPRGAFFLDADQFQPFVGVGATYHEIDFVGNTESNYGSDVIAGFVYDLGSASIRGEARYQVDKVDELSFGTITIDDTFYTYAFMLGVSFPFGEKPLPYNYDSDGDGVPDRLDKCPNTPRGTPVDSNGCPLDSDGDGVPNFRDKCPDTPRGAAVNADGCSIDDDGDGVPNNIDECPDTPRGVAVNSRGCPLDSDGDGVPDDIDECPGTLPGMAVNSRGCVVSQVFELNGVHFEFDKARLMLDSKTVLDGVAKSLKNEPNIRIVIQGHTDSVGSDQYNQRLSQDRAQSVVNYLSSRGIDIGRFRAVGYGESRPVATNATDDGRERNRRVELEVISPEN